MKLTADYHTHTTFSHGKGSIYDNAAAAEKMGLTELGISDHGFAHPAFGLTAKKLPLMRSLCDAATAQTGVKTLLGIESNIISTDGKTDLKQKYYDYFDIYLAGFHKFVLYEFPCAFSLFAPNFAASLLKYKPSAETVKRTTKTFINVIEKNPVDAITHLNFCCFTDVEEVAKCARDNGAYIEINAKKLHMTQDELFRVGRTGVKFIISSDAHSPDRVGEISLVENLLNNVDIPLQNIANIDGRLPDFRFKKFKENR